MQFHECCQLDQKLLERERCRHDVISHYEIRKVLTETFIHVSYFVDTWLTPQARHLNELGYPKVEFNMSTLFQIIMTIHFSAGLSHDPR
jgi:hypothetical protein